jgi:hypothetical protein
VSKIIFDVQGKFISVYLISQFRRVFDNKRRQFSKLARVLLSEMHPQLPAMYAKWERDYFSQGPVVGAAV